MGDPSSSLDAGAEPDGASPPRAPRWVRVSVLIAIVVAVVIGALVLLGNHGPGRHEPARHGPGLHQPGGQEADAPTIR